MVCESVGEAITDVAGIGVLLGFGIQALISLLLSAWTFYLSKIGLLNRHSDRNTIEYGRERKRLELVSATLMTGEDAQMLTGIALVVTALARNHTMGLYHLHLIFDTVSLVGVSSAAALTTNAFIRNHEGSPKKGPYLLQLNLRYLAIYAFAALYLALLILLNVRLSDWNDDDPGKCYNSALLTSPKAKHPTADKTYVSMTGIWLIICLLWAAFGSGKRTRTVLAFGLLQFPVHVYMLIVLRQKNQGLLEGEGSENEWGYGQTVTVVLLVDTVISCVKGLLEYYRFEREVGKSEAARDADEERAGDKKGSGGFGNGARDIVTSVSEDRSRAAAT